MTFLLAFFLLATSSFFTTAAANPSWLDYESKLSVQRIIQNVSPSDAKPGAVIAAQTRHNPNYYYHWVRDAGLVMDAVVTQYLSATNPTEKNILRVKLNEYLDFSDHIQKVPVMTGLGEPKFHVDGSAFTDPWGRPQNDSPALRAISLIRWAQVLLQEGQGHIVRKKLYDSKLPAHTIIKRDLEYVSHHWREPSFDLWEEVKGDHFYTRMVQRRALIDGAKFARVMGDVGAAVWYEKQAKEIEKTLSQFWDPSRGYFVATLNRTEGLHYKHSQLDTAVILGLLHGKTNDGIMSFNDVRVQSTLEKLTEAFAKEYKINHRAGIPGVAIGRYPEDKYGGAHFNAGNPWPLCTLAIAEAYYEAAAEKKAKGQKAEALILIDKGDQFVTRVQYHSHVDGSLNEQIDRNTGYMTSVSDLTWNYAAILTAFWARSQ